MSVLPRTFRTAGGGFIPGIVFGEADARTSDLQSADALNTAIERHLSDTPEAGMSFGLNT